MLSKIFSRAKQIFLSIVFLFTPLTTSAIRFPSPIGEADPYEIVARVIKAFLGLVGVAALLNFVIAGIGLINSRGNAEKVKKHQENLVWTIIGITILFAGYAILSYFFQQLAGTTGVGVNLFDPR